MTEQQLGKYQLVRKLATGGMAEVFLAKAAGPMGFEKTLVLKRILPHLAEEPAFVDMFLVEAKLAARLTHSHIAQIFDFGESEGAYFLAMEYIDGPSLRTLIKRAATHGLAPPPVVCARLISHACEGLAFAHDFADPETGEPLGLIHRDISPDNILLSRQGEVKVVDFGIAKAAGQSHRTETGALKGKLPYMAPEQVRSGHLDKRVDVYALGVVLYELLTTRKPFVAGSDAELMQAILHQHPVPAEQLRPDLPEHLADILDRALAKDREERYPDCASFQADLEDFILSMGRSVTTQYVAQYITHTLSGTECPMPTPHSGSARGRSGAGSSPGRPSLTSQASVEPAPARRLPAEALADPDDETQPLQAEGTRTQASPPPASPAPRRWLLPLVGGALVLSTVALVGSRLGRTEAPPPPPASLAAPAPVARLTPPSPPAPAETPVQPPPAESAPPAEADPSDEDVQAPGPERVPSARSKRVGAAARAGPKGSLELRIFPYATVFVDGRRLGETPMGPALLPAGTHTLKLVNAKLSKTVTRTIEIKPEQPTVLKVNLQEE